MDTNPLHDAYRALLDAAGSAEFGAPPDGEWSADQILAHVSVITAATITAVCSAGTGAVAAYDNRLAQDPWTLERVIALAGGRSGLRTRIGLQAEALCAVGGAMLSEAELGALIPTVLVSNGKMMVDGPVSLRDLLAGLAAAELPGHTAQLRSLLPRSS